MPASHTPQAQKSSRSFPSPRELKQPGLPHPPAQGAALGQQAPPLWLEPRACLQGDSSFSATDPCSLLTANTHPRAEASGGQASPREGGGEGCTRAAPASRDAGTHGRPRTRGP